MRASLQEPKSDTSRKLWEGDAFLREHEKDEAFREDDDASATDLQHGVH